MELFFFFLIIDYMEIVWENKNVNIFILEKKKYEYNYFIGIVIFISFFVYLIVNKRWLVFVFIILMIVNVESNYLCEFVIFLLYI